MSRSASAADGEEARAWLQAVQEVLNNAFARSNFYDGVHLLYHELGVFGTGCLLVAVGLRLVLMGRPEDAVARA